jgi:parallel beta-helix repeat protein
MASFTRVKTWKTTALPMTPTSVDYELDNLTRGLSKTFAGFFVVYPEQFGAKSDGVNDDAVAIQAAVNSLPNGGIIQFSARPYYLKSLVTISNHCIIFKGYSVGMIPGNYGGTYTIGTQLIGTNGVGAFKVNNVGYIEFRDFSLYLPSGSTTACDGIYINGFRTRLSNVQVANYSNCVHVISSTDIYIQDCLFESTNSTISPSVGLNIDGSAHLQVQSIYVSNCVSAGTGFSGLFYPYWLHGNRINDCHFTDCEADSGSYGFYIDGSSGLDSGFSGDIHLVNCVSASNISYGYYVNTCAGSTMINIVNSYCGGSTIGAYVSASAGVNITNCEINSTSGIYFSNSTNCIANANTVIGSTVNAIVLDGSTYCTVNDNVLTAAASAGTNGVNMINTSTNNVVKGNVCSGGSAGFNDGISASSGSTHNTVVGNQMPPTICTTPFALLQGTNIRQTVLNDGDPVNTFTPAYSGFSANPSGTMYYTKVGQMVSVSYIASAGGTSNATTFTMTLPFEGNASMSSQYYCVGSYVNGGVTSGPGIIEVVQSSTTANIYPSGALSTWGATLGKYVVAMAFTYITD